MSGELERALRLLAAVAEDPTPDGKHIDEPLLALMRDGDQADDLNDALAHAARCADCRARLTEGQQRRRSVVVMAIEAPRMSQRDLAKAVEGTHARLLERGAGRWTAVVDAANAEKLLGELEKPDSSVVSRLAVGTPFEIPVDELRGARKQMPSFIEMPANTGTDAAEVSVWAQVGRKPKQRDGGSSVSPGWLSFAIAAILGAMLLAYFLATR